MSTIKILAFAGSARKDSFNKKMVQVAAKGAEEAGVSVTVVDLADFEMPIFDEDVERESGMPEKAKKLKELMKEHQGFLVASPEYNSSISPLLKNVIDWASRKEDGEKSLEAFDGKVVVLMSASPGSLGGLRGLSQIRWIFNNIKSIVLPDQVALPAAYEAFDADGNIQDSAMQDRVMGLGKRLAEFLKLIQR